MTISNLPQGTPPLDLDPHVAYVLRLGDDNLVLAQRLGEWISRGPDLEEDIALANIGLDHIGVARNLLTHAGALEAEGRSEDDLAMLRSEREYLNLLLFEQPNGDFAHTMGRQLFVDAWQVPLWERLSTSVDTQLAGIAQKAVKEARYHLRHSSTWVIRLGDGTEESAARMQRAIDRLWRYTGELFLADDVDAAMVDAGIGVDPGSLRPVWEATITDVFDDAGLERPDDDYVRAGGRHGFHGAELGHMLGEMQWLARAHPGAQW